MDKAKQAVSSFVSRNGKHTTTVDEEMRAAVTEEHVRPRQHEEVTTAVDKEVHQEHHHTIVQPIKAKEVLPEQHTHNMAAVEHKTFDHRNDADVRANLERDAAKYRDTTVTHGTAHTTSAAPVVEAERVHHHVHEHIQPVIQKEVIAPQVIHTTVPIHETHHAEAVHHGTSVLPTKTLEEFRSDKGVLEGRDITKLTEYEGCPPTYKKDLQAETLEGDKSMHLHSHAHGSHSGEHGLGHSHTSGTHTGSHTGSHTGTGLGSSVNAGPHDSKLANKADPRVDSDLDGRGTRSGNTGNTRTGGLGGQTNSTLEGRGTGTTGNTGALGSTGHTATGTTKPSLADKLNPFKDADRDGKKGLMD